MPFLTLMGEFPGHALDRINGKLIQQKFMTAYQLLNEFSSKTVQFATPKLKFRKKWLSSSVISLAYSLAHDPEN